MRLSRKDPNSIVISALAMGLSDHLILGSPTALIGCSC